MWYKRFKRYTQLKASKQNSFLRNKSKRALRGLRCILYCFLGWVMCHGFVYCIHSCCNTYSIYSFVFMGYSTIIINLKQNSIVFWNKGFSTPIPQLSIPSFSEIVTVTGFLQSFQRYPIHRQVRGWGARVCGGWGAEGVYSHICARETEKNKPIPPTVPHQSGV